MENNQDIVQGNNEQVNTEQPKSYNLLNDFYLPLKSTQEIYNSNAYKTLSANNIDTAELFNTEKDRNSHSIVINKEYPLDEAAKKTAFELVKNVSSFIRDIPAAAGDKLINGLVQGGILAVNMAPITNKVLGSPIDENFVMENSISASNTLKETLKKNNEDFKKGFNLVNGRDLNSASELIGYVAQDAPYALPIYKGLKAVGVNDTTATFMAFGIGSAIAFAPEETSISLNMFTQEIGSVKKFLNILPNTPNDELFNRSVQLFEGTALGKYLPEIVKVGRFLKKYVPEYAPGGSVAVAGATTIGEITDQTILNPKEEITPQITDGLNQNQSILNTIKSGVDQFGNKLTEIGGAIKKEFSGEAMANPLVSKGVNELAPKLAPIFKSSVVEAIEKIPNKAPGNQILGTIKNIPGVTQTEMKWIGLDDFLKDKPSVTKQEVSDFIQANKIDVVERKYTGEQKLPEDFLQKVKSFESKWSNLSTKEITDKVKVGDWQFENLNYDQYRVSFGKEKGNMDFNTLSQVLGTKPTLDDLVKLDNGNLTVKDKSTLGRGYLKEDKERIDTFQINPVEFEKYQIENERRKFAKLNPQAKFERYTEKGGSDYTELVFKINKNEMPVEADMAGKVSMSYRSPSAHYGQVGEFAHVRFKTREYNGQKILSVEEMQSDIMNQIKDGELKLTSGLKVTDFPFKNNWYEFVTKRLTRYAADNGFDSIAFQKGVVSADRYNELKKLDKFNIGSIDEKRGLIGFEASDTDNVLQISDQFKIDNLKKEYPKIAPEVILFVQELQKTKGMTRQAAKEFLIDLNSKSKNFEIAVETTLENYYSDVSKGVRGLEFTSRQPIEIGGEGKKEFYDKIVPNYVKKYAKKWNAPVYDDVIDINKIPVTILKLTPEMKRSVQDKSQPLFNIIGPALVTSGGAKVISDSIGNNTISEPTKNQ